MTVLILANVAAVALETVPAIWTRYQQAFLWFDMVSVGIFSVEYALRVWASAEHIGASGKTPMEKRLRYLVSPLAIIDLLAILPFYLGAFVNADLRALRIFRLLRLFKLVRYSPAITSLSRVFVRERHALFAAFLIMIGILFMSATLAHLVEGNAQPEAFGTIPDALWWSLATLTTVGYGDVVPITDWGRVLGAIVMVVGFAFYAVPIGIIASGFADEVHRRAFVVPVRLIESVPIFKGIDPETAKELASHLRTVNVPPGTVVTHKMDEQNGLFCLISGSLVAFQNHRPVDLQPGDFFGEVGMISDAGSQPSTITRGWVRLMKLDSVDLHTLLSIFPDMSASMKNYGQTRLTEMQSDGAISEPEKHAMLDQLQRDLDRG